MSDPQILLRLIQVFIDSRIVSIITQSFTLDPSDLADGAGETKSVTITGAQLGDFVIIAPPYDLQDLIVTAYVQASNTIELRIQNENAGANVNLASGTWKAMVIRTG